MSPRLREAELSDPVSAWFRKRGFTVYAEVPALNRSLDLVALHAGADLLIGIELKMACSKIVIKQAAIAQLACDQVYVAVPTRPTERAVRYCRNYCIGVLRVQRDAVLHLLQAGQQDAYPDPMCRRRLVEQLGELQPGGIGGLPNLPADSLADAHRAPSESVKP